MEMLGGSLWKSFPASRSEPPEPPKSNTAALCQTALRHVPGSIVARSGVAPTAPGHQHGPAPVLVTGAAGRRSRAGMLGHEGRAPDSLCGVIYDPGGELKFLCPPQTGLSNEADALFIIKAAKSF